MHLSLDLDQMAVADKFLMMEKLWQDLSTNAYESGFTPKWHINLLNDREMKIKEGKSTFSDLSTVKNRDLEIIF